MPVLSIIPDLPESQQGVGWAVIDGAILRAARRVKNREQPLSRKNVEMEMARANEKFRLWFVSALPRPASRAQHISVILKGERKATNLERAQGRAVESMVGVERSSWRLVAGLSERVSELNWRLFPVAVFFLAVVAWVVGLLYAAQSPLFRWSYIVGVPAPWVLVVSFAVFVGLSGAMVLWLAYLIGLGVKAWLARKIAERDGALVDLVVSELGQQREL